MLEMSSGYVFGDCRRPAWVIPPGAVSENTGTRAVIVYGPPPAYWTVVKRSPVSTSVVSRSTLATNSGLRTVGSWKMPGVIVTVTFVPPPPASSDGSSSESPRIGEFAGRISDDVLSQLQRRLPSYVAYVPAIQRQTVVTLPSTLAVKATPDAGSHWPPVVALDWNPTAPKGRGWPPAGASRWMRSESPDSFDGRSVHIPCRGADDAAVVRTSAPNTAAVTNWAPPVR